MKVAAYARVSTNSEALLHSLSAQVSYYSSLIQNNPDWDYVGVYADEGITGTSQKHRNEFNRLLADCEEGKIDMILVKSISRFARNTVDCLKATRHLRDLGMAVYFERENINSLTQNVELMLTLLASFAQEESRSISENIKWAIRKKFEQRIPNGHKAPYGYKWDGEIFRIVLSQGKIVKEIYRRYFNGESAYKIAKDLAKQGVTGQLGNPLEQTTIKEILSNQSYTGTMVLQKNFLNESHKRKKNKGELPMYLVEDMFEPLVSEEEYKKTLNIRKKGAETFSNNRNSLTVFSGKVKCGYCGFGVSRRTTKNRKKWTCKTKERKGINHCDCRPIWETELIEATTEAIGKDFDDNIFLNEIKQINLYSDRVEFHMSKGDCKNITCKYTGERGKNAFTGKIWCGICKNKKVWVCSSLRKECQAKYILESEILKTAEQLLGKNYQAKVVADINSIIVKDYTLDFEFKNGDVKTWQRKQEPFRPHLTDSIPNL